MIARSRLQRRIWLSAALAAAATTIYVCVYAAPGSDSQSLQIGATDARSWLNLADEALLRSDVKAYAHALAQAVDAGGSGEDHARAVAGLADYQWRIAGEPTSAVRTLDSFNPRQPAPLLERARLELALGHYEASRVAALSALAVSTQRADIQRSKTSFGRAVADELLHDAVAGHSGPLDADTLFQKTLDLLGPYVEREPGLREPSQIALLAALWSGDGTAAKHAWESYFRLPADADAPQPLVQATATMRAIPALLDGAAPELRLSVIDALNGGRLFAPAAVLAIHWDLANSTQGRDAVAYARWTSDLSRTLDEQYRRAAMGAKLPNEEALLDDRGPELWRDLGLDPKAYSMPRLTEELRRRFGAVIRTNSAGTNYGHIVSNQLETIEQYGHRTQLRSLVLDTMVSNAYTSWLWDGRAEVGGWVASGEDPATIVSVRPETSLAAWVAITDPEVMKQDQEDLDRWAKEDDDRARQNPYSYLPGLRLRMRLGGARRVYNRERASGLDGPALRSAFLAEYDRLMNASSITAHEGRHALDKQSHDLALGARIIFGGGSEELEYRAKLSQVAFAPDPLIAMNGIFISNIGQKGDAHGMANLRIMHGIVKWMESHASDIHGLNRNRPLLPQFDLLTDEQMRTAFRSMDPWASSH